MAKKSFKDNPALNFITPPAPARPAPSAAAGPAGVQKTAPEAPLKPNPLYVETKSKRVQLLMQPGLHARLKELAGRRRQSLNDLIHTVLSGWAEEEN